jgi:hypothetical protein
MTTDIHALKVYKTRGVHATDVYHGRMYEDNDDVQAANQILSHINEAATVYQGDDEEDKGVHRQKIKPSKKVHHVGRGVDGTGADIITIWRAGLSHPDAAQVEDATKDDILALDIQDDQSDFSSITDVFNRMAQKTAVST